jgi:hypothetical protein
MEVYWYPNREDPREEAIDSFAVLSSSKGLYEWHTTGPGQRLDEDSAVFVPAFNGRGSIANPVPLQVLRVAAKVRREPKVAYASDDRDVLLLQQAAFAAERQRFLLSDGVMLGYVSDSLPFRIDVLLQLCEQVTVVPTTVAQAGLWIGSPDDHVVILRGISPVGRIELTLLPAVDYMPARVSIAADKYDIAGWRPLGHHLLSEYRNLVRDGVQDQPAVSQTTVLSFSGVIRLKDRSVPSKAQCTVETRFEDGAFFASRTTLERTEVSMTTQALDFSPPFPEGLNIYRPAGGPGVPEQWRDGAVRLAMNPKAIAAVDEAVAETQSRPRTNGQWRVLWPLAFLLLLAAVPVAIILHTRRRAAP